MSVARIASRYAKSLFDLAIKEGKLDKVHDDVTLIRKVAQNEEFASVMKNPLISTEKKESIFEAIFKEKIELITLNTLMVMVEHRRELYLTDICRIFHVMFNEAKHVSQVIITTAEAISEKMTEDILAEFKAKGLIETDVELTTKIDPSIVGGFIVQFGDQVYNASIAYKVKELRTKFSENLYIKNF